MCCSWTGTLAPRCLTVKFFTCCRRCNHAVSWDGRYFYPKSIPWEGLEQERLSDYQVIALCNVEALTPQVRQRLYQFVVEGRLFFFAGNRVDPVRYNAMFYRSDTLLLPLALGQPAQRQQEQPIAIGTVHSAHEALATFAGEEALLQRGKFYRYVTMEGANTVPGVRMLLALQDGSPLLVDKDLGRGRVLFFASSADRDWTDLPTRTAYVPLIHGSSRLRRAFVSGIAASWDHYARGHTPARTGGGRWHHRHHSHARWPGTPDPLRTRWRPDSSTIHILRSLASIVWQRQQSTDFLAVNGTRAESNFEKIQATEIQTRLRPLSVVLEEEGNPGASCRRLCTPYARAGESCRC